jgi:hypothetical protein
MARRTVPTARPVCAVRSVIEGQLRGDLASLDLIAQLSGDLFVGMLGGLEVDLHDREPSGTCHSEACPAWGIRVPARRGPAVVLVGVHEPGQALAEDVHRGVGVFD